MSDAIKELRDYLAKSPSMVYPQDVLEYLPAIEAENAKLRELLANVPKCEACEAMLDCDECLRADGSHKERRRLSAENARLRSELESVGTASYLYGRSDLKAENAKLRELVASVWRLFTEHGAVHPSDLPEVDAVRDRMRELGVEVTE